MTSKCTPVNEGDFFSAYLSQIRQNFMCSRDFYNYNAQPPQWKALFTLLFIFRSITGTILTSISHKRQQATLRHKINLRRLSVTHFSTASSIPKTSIRASSTKNYRAQRKISHDLRKIINLFQQPVVQPPNFYASNELVIWFFYCKRMADLGRNMQIGAYGLYEPGSLYGVGSENQ